MKPNQDHDQIFKSQYSTRSNQNQYTSSVGDDTDIPKRVMINTDTYQLLSNSKNENPGASLTCLSIYQTLLSYSQNKKLMVMLSHTHSLTLSLCIIVGYKQCRQKVTQHRQHFQESIFTLAPLPIPTKPPNSKIIHINTKPHNPKNPKYNSFYAFDDSKRHQQKQIHTSKKR